MCQFDKRNLCLPHTILGTEKLNLKKNKILALSEKHLLLYGSNNPLSFGALQGFFAYLFLFMLCPSMVPK